MLQSMRKSAKSWVMVFLFGLLILSFGLWGIGDVFRTGVRGNETVAEVGEIKITVDQYRRTLRNFMNVQGQRLGLSLTMKQARAFGLDRRVLLSMIQERVMALGAGGIGIVINTDLVSRDIQQNPNFKNQFDQFDRQTFIALLRNAGLSEAGYVAQRQGELARAHLSDAVSAARRMPRMMVERFYRYRNDKRVAEILLVADASVKNAPKPRQSQLTAYHKKNAASYTAPELRDITAIILTPEAIATEVSVSDEDLKKSYADRKAEFVQAEKRDVEQMLFTNQAKAKQAIAALKEGKSFEVVAREIAGQNTGGLALGSFTKAELKTRMAPLADAAFKIGIGKYSEPIKSVFGWHIVRVTKIVASATKSFAEVKTQIKSAIQKERAGDLLVKLSNQIEDMMGGGSTLKEAATKLNLKAAKFIGLSRRGTDINGAIVKGLPKATEFLTNAFKIDLDEDSGVVESEQGAVFVLRVDKISKPALRTLKDVRAKVAKAWMAEYRNKAARKKAAALLSRANSGETIAKIAKDSSLTARTTDPFTRSGTKAGKNVPAGLITKIFKAKKGITVMARTKGGYALARVTDIKPADPKNDKKGMDAIRTALVKSINADLLDSYQKSLRERYKVTIDNSVLTLFFEQTPR